MRDAVPEEKQRNVPMTDRLRVLVTRPRDQAAATARRLRALGHVPLVDPLLKIVPATDVVEPGGAAALVLTSANAVHALDPALVEGRLVFAVGQATAAAIRRRTGIEPLAGLRDGAALANLIAAHLAPGAGSILHLSGDKVQGDLGRRLEALGFACRRQIVYRALAADGLRERTLRAMQDHRLSAVLLYSPRSAAIFRNLVAAADLVETGRLVRLVCLSSAVAAEVESLGWDSLHVAREPSETALLERLGSPPSRLEGPGPAC